MSERSTTVTIKYGKNYDDTWAVFKGAPIEVRQDIVDYYGLAPEREWTLNDVVLAATQAAHGLGAIVNGFGGATRSEDGTVQTAVVPIAESSSGSSDVWDQASSTPAEPAAPAVNPLLAQIAGVANVADLKRMWAENQAEFADPEIMAAWKARGKALQTA